MVKIGKKENILTNLNKSCALTSFSFLLGDFFLLLDAAIFLYASHTWRRLGRLQPQYCLIEEGLHAA